VTTREHSELESLEAYLLGALTPHEQGEMERHVRECLRCRAEIRSYQRTMDVLPLLAPVRKAPRGLRDRVMRQVYSIARPRWQRAAALAGGVAAGVALLVGGYFAYAGYNDLESEVNDLSDRNAALTEQVNAISPQAERVGGINQRLNSAETEADRLQWAMSRQRDAMVALTNPENVKFSGRPTELEPGARGSVVWDGTNKTLYLFINNLPQLAGGNTYRLWLSDNFAAKVVPMGTFNADAQGFVSFQQKISEGIDNYSTLLVTIEASGTATEFAGNTVLIASLVQGLVAVQFGP
jgi:hypothetical protein